MDQLDVGAVQRAFETIEMPEQLAANSIALPQPADERPDRQVYRQISVQLMKQAFGVWQVSTEKNKFDLAEQSGIWRVHLDRSSLQTRTLDKYFSLETLPTNPRWRDVIATAEFVLEQCVDHPNSNELAKLDELRETLVQLVRDGAAKWT